MDALYLNAKEVQNEIKSFFPKAQKLRRAL